MSVVDAPGFILAAPIQVSRRRSATICVSGGAGFLGSHLCTALVERGDDVIALDNFHTGRRANVEHLMGTGHFSLVEHDIVHPLPGDLPAFDEIYNLACPASPVHYQSDPLSTLGICSLGTRNMLERAVHDGARIFHASTSEIYGDPDVHPQPESYWGNVNTLGPRSCYDEGKRFSETLIYEYARRYDVSTRMARIFNTYGPRMQPDDGRVVSNFVIQALKGEDITVYGDGLQTRSFCYVDDLIAGIIGLMESDDPIEGAVNIGNPVEVTVLDLARIVIDMTHSSSRIVHRALPQDDPRRRRPDIGRAHNMLGWAPTIALCVGLQHTIEYFAREIASGDLERGMAERGFIAA
ncbi:UDP-glucuronic acid decarboxylase family protein [Allosphingosinicella vermicomposti]|uniref:UDP-glucuronic acid decarboxylase family protein n=1 Tax=Allosphingosinicella vermicomposti TaxID=614671 RepID=UPI000D10ED09|nr:UDP-glucuronic acid decarboxylase family protein [Allosphingosinicella vermicomposti]